MQATVKWKKWNVFSESGRTDRRTPQERRASGVKHYPASPPAASSSSRLLVRPPAAMVRFSFPGERGLNFRKSTFREYFESVAITAIIALFATTFVLQAFKIPTGSMESNLLIGDHLLVNKFVYGIHPGGLA